jgi:hypothetical protein
VTYNLNAPNAVSAVDKFLPFICLACQRIYNNCNEFRFHINIKHTAETTNCHVYVSESLQWTLTALKSTTDDDATVDLSISELQKSLLRATEMSTMRLQQNSTTCAAHGLQSCALCEQTITNSPPTALPMTSLPPLMQQHSTIAAARNSCKTLKCPKCNWHYKYQETLEIHMKEKHADDEVTCVYCLHNRAHPKLARGEAYSCGYKPYR